LWARTIDRPQVTTFCEKLTGAKTLEVGRRGKYIVITLDSAKTLLVHLRMSGKFTLRTSGEGPDNDKHTRVRIQLDDGTWVTYIDPRKFGRFYLVDEPEDVLGNLGPEPLSEGFTVDWLTTHLAGRRGEIKRLLLDQHFLVGLGNIYVSEALWQAQIHPQRIAGSLTEDETQRLHTAIVNVLSQGVQNRGTSLGDQQYVYPDGNLGRHQHYLQVYDRAADQCPRCGYAIKRIVQGQRSSYFCPVCQHLPDEA
jgi:formamidopyrimidine-DNA glycosylase